MAVNMGRVLFAAVFLIRISFCVGVNINGMAELQEVTINSADAQVVRAIDNDNASVLDEALWKDEAVSPEIQSDAPYRGLFGQTGSFNFSTPTELQTVWADLLDSRLLNEFLVRCDQEPDFEVGMTRNLSALQAFVAFVVIGYTAIAMWIGPVTLSCWQRRSLSVTYAAAALAQLIFLAQVFGCMTVRSAYPLTLVIVLVFFVAFNCTNALLLLEAEEAEDIVHVQQIVESSPNRIVTSQRARCY